MGSHMHLLGYASGLAGADLRCGDGPRVLRASSLKKCHWDLMVEPTQFASESLPQSVQTLCKALAERVSQLIRNHESVTVLGGDHSCAIGTWSGAYDALHHQGEMGLIWIDAHMDSHTPDTTHSGRIHGMPLACLLGYGYPVLTSILNAAPKLQPENVCLIGVRSYEPEEAEFLQRLNVKIFYMNEIKQRGFATIWQEAVAHVNKHTIGFGISLDLDGIDPDDAPAVDVPEPNGIHADDLLKALCVTATDPRLLMTEIVEFDPHCDKNQQTEKLINQFVSILSA